MKTKKKLAAWQFGIMLGLQILFFSTMFIPFFHINKSVIKNMQKDAEEMIRSMDEDMVENLLEIGDVDDLINDFEIGDYDIEKLKEEEKKAGIKISNITPAWVMTRNLLRFVSGKEADDPEVIADYKESIDDNPSLKSIVSFYNTLRVLFWTIYILDIIVMVLTIVAFIVAWRKEIPTIINSVYALLGTILFGILRFGLIGMVTKKVFDLVLDDLGAFSKLVDTKALANLYVKILSNLYAAGPLIAFIASLLLLAFSIVCIFLGGTKVEPEIINNPPYPPIPDPVPIPPTPIPTPDPVPIPTPMPIPTPVPTPIPQPVTPAPVVSTGKVMCTKGVAVGQGFQLPVDRKVVVGKSPSKANLVINNQNVSNVHCSIRYNAAHNTYIIKDHSTNGTFANGVKLPADTPVEYPAGTVLSLADGTNEITLG